LKFSKEIKNFTAMFELCLIYTTFKVVYNFSLNLKLRIEVMLWSHDFDIKL